MSLLQKRVFSCLFVVAAAGLLLASCGDDAAAPPVRVLAFSVEPVNAVAGVNITSFAVEILDADDVLVDTDTRNVTLDVATGSGTLVGTVTVKAIDGVATFTTVNIEVADTYTLIATASGATADTSVSFVISPDVATQFVIVDPTDGTVDAAITVTVEAQDQYGNVVTTYAETVTLVADGDATGGVVTISAGVGTLDISDQTAETVALSLTNLAADLTVSSTQDVVFAAGAATKVVITAAGADITVDETTTLTVEVQDQYDNTVTTDSTTVVTFTPTNSGTISDVTVGTGDNTYAGGVEDVTVVAGVATVVLADIVIETFEVAITDDAGLTDPANDSIDVTIGAAAKVVITAAGSNITTDDTTTLTVQVQDQYDNLVTADSTTVVTFTPTLSGTISDVTVGTGDDTYDGGAEGVTVNAGVATVVLSDTVVETFEVAISSALTDPANDSIDVAVGAASQVVITTPGGTFVVDGTTTLTVEVQDAGGNTVTTDSTTVVTFTPTLSGTISDVTVGTGDDTYDGGAEGVTVNAGIATVELSDTVVETFEVAISSALTDPANDSIVVTAAP